jgi:DNA modification methylase
LLCGDSLKKDNIKRLLQDNIIDLVFCDPPYNLAADDITHQEHHTDFAMASGEMTKEEFIDFLKSYMSHAVEFSKDGSIHYHCMDWRHIEEMVNAGKQVYGEEGLKNLCVWAKDCLGMGSFYRSQHELIFIFKKGAGKHTVNFGAYSETKAGKERNRGNIWNYPSASSFASKNDEGEMYMGKTKDHLKIHPTPKPLELVIDAIKDCSNNGERVLDLFGGSGTTLIACEKTNRQAFICEFEEKYCDYILHRWENVTGGKGEIISKTDE